LYNRAAPTSFALHLARKDLALVMAAGYEAGPACSWWRRRWKRLQWR
jgi:hypothetical protein